MRSNYIESDISFVNIKIPTNITQESSVIYWRNTVYVKPFFCNWKYIERFVETIRLANYAAFPIVQNAI